jgi:hypothetical protein
MVTENGMVKKLEAKTKMGRGRPYLLPLPIGFK